MPTVPLVSSPVFGSDGTSNVRADPNINAPMAAANQHLAAAIGQVGELAAKVKHASDTAYVIGAQSKMESATEDFHTWTLDHPDTDSWKEEWDARRQAVTDDIQQGGTRLSPMAKLHLQTETQSWQNRANSGIGHLQTQQQIKNATGELNEALNTAVALNDEEGARAVIDVGRKQGIFSGAHAAAAEKRVSLGIATNVANLDIQADPFAAPERLEAKDEEGNFLNYKGLTPSARTSMLFRASKLASETRAQTMRDWSTSIAQAQMDGSPMPDKDGILQEAARQGISPKWVERQFKAPAPFDKDEYAAARNEIAALNLADDPDSKNAARAMELVTHFKGPAATALEKMVKDRTDPEHPINANPIFKDADHQNAENFRLGIYGKFETRTQDKDGHWTTHVNATALRQAQETQARVRDSLMQFIQQHPQAKHEEVTKFLNSTYRAQVTKVGSSIFKFNP